jgi:hypothetical protein
VAAAKEEIARQLSESTGRTVALTPSQVADYLAAERELRPLGLNVAQAAVRLVEAAKQYARRQCRKKLPEILLPDAVKLFVESKEKKNCSKRYVDEVKRRGVKLSEVFRCGISGIGVSELEAFLDKLKGDANRANYREFLVGLFRFAQRRGFLPRDARTEAEQLEAGAARGGEIEIYTPAELHAALRAARNKERLAVAMAVTM